MEAGQPLSKLRSTGSWGVLQRMHRMLPELYPAPITLYCAHLRDHPIPDASGDLLNRVFPWMPNPPGMRQRFT